MRPKRFFVAAALLSGVSSLVSAGADDTGKDIYHGAPGSVLERVTANVGALEVDLPAASFPCASCHGEDGQGRTERGVVPSDLRKPILERARKSVMAGQRARNAYDRVSFHIALTQGVDSSGNRLNEAMPKFELTRAQTDAIWDYLDRLDQRLAPGVSDNEIRLGVVYEPADDVAQKAAVNALLSAYTERINAAGGIYGRTLFLETLSPDRDAENLFAVLVPNARFTPETDRIVIGTRVRPEPGRNVFRLLSDNPAQAAALRAFAITHLGEIIAPAESCAATQNGLVLVTGPDCFDALRGGRIGLFTSKAFDDWAPISQQDLPQEIYVSLPFAIDQIDDAAQRAFARFRQDANLESRHGLAQSEAYSALVVAIEALFGAGRSLTDERFIERMTIMSDFNGAMTPPLSFSLNRRVGVSASLVAKFDPISGQFDLENAVWVDPVQQTN